MLTDLQSYLLLDVLLWLTEQEVIELVMAQETL